MREQGGAQRRGAAPRPAPAAAPRPRPAAGRGRRGRPPAPREQFRATREKLRDQLRAGALDARTVEVEVREKSFPVLPDPVLAGRRGDGRQPQGPAARPLRRARRKRRRLTVPEAREVLLRKSRRGWWTRSRWRALAVERVQTSGIVFIDEIDKIAGPRGRPRPRRLAARACSATSCPSSRARPSPPSTGRCAPTTSSSSPPAPSTSPSPPTSSPSCRAASPSASSWRR